MMWMKWQAYIHRVYNMPFTMAEREARNIGIVSARSEEEALSRGSALAKRRGLIGYIGVEPLDMRAK